MAIVVTHVDRIRPRHRPPIGGIVSSTLLTLLVLPTVYSWIEGRRGRIVAVRSVQ